MREIPKSVQSNLWLSFLALRINIDNFNLDNKDLIVGL